MLKPKAEKSLPLEEELEFLAENALDEETDEENQVTATLTTDQILPVKAIGRSCLLLEGGKVATLLRVQGQDVSLMSSFEQHALIRHIAGLFNTMNGAFSFYCITKPRDMRPYLEEMDKKRAAETNPKIRQQYWVVYDFLKKLHEEKALTERNYFVTMQANPNDVRSANSLADEDEKKPNFTQTIKTRFQVAVLGKDPNESKAEGNSKKKGERAIDPVLAENVRFRAQSFADNSRFGGSLCSETEITEVLAEMLGSVACGEHLDPLAKIGAVEFIETESHLKIGQNYYATLYITEFPRTMRPAALLEITRFRDIQMFIAVHADPLPGEKAEAKLKQKQQILIAVSASEQSAAGDMSRMYHIESLRQIRDVLARGEARLFSGSLRIAVKAATRKRLFADLRRIAQRLKEMGFEVATASRNQRRAFFSTIPLGHDWLGQEKFISDRTRHPNLTGENIACLLPNCIVDFSQKNGFIQGMSRADGSPVLLNYWDLTNPHSTVCATSGGGKTVSMEHELMMEMLTNPKLQAYYIDPQGVLGNFANLVDGTMIDLGSKGKAIINPMDKYVLNGREEELGERLQFLRPLIELMLKCEMTATERSAFTRAIKRLYYHFEDGESILPILERSYVMQTLYAPIHKRLGEVMAKLKEIYDFLREKYQIPTTGRVAGIRGATRPTRPVCHLEGGRWYYKGEGETATALPEMKLKEGEAQPAPVWYPAKEWFNSLAQEFSRLVQEEGVFDGLDRVAKRSAIRDAFIELKLGMPILEDLMPFLAAEEIPHLVSNLEPYYDRAVYGDLFNGYTNVALDKRFVGFNVRDLDDPILKSIRIFQVINFTWGMVRGRRIPGKAVIPCRFIVDEFGVLLETFPDVVNYVSTLFKRGRYFGLAMTIIVQNLSSLLDYPAAKECVENSSRILLLKQEKTALHRIQSHFGLTNSQVEALLNARPGDALQKVNEQWVQFKYTVPKEHLAAYDTRPKQAEEI